MTKCALDHYDSLLLDLDGTVWEGGRLLPYVENVINETTVPVMYITNNASRHPSTVASLLSKMGVPTGTEQILTSAQAAVEMAADHLQPGDSVYVLGTDSFKDLATTAGYIVVDSADDNPKAVLHGHNPQTGWAQLSEAALAIAQGAKYFASNLDSTLPMERGLMVGNGSMIQAVVHATGIAPTSAGKPEPAMFYSAAAKLSSKRPLGVGDRLNTDIAGGVAAGFDTLHVLTGVSKHFALLRAPQHERPTYIARDFSDVRQPLETLKPGAQGGFVAHWDGDHIVLSGGDSESRPDQALRTVLQLAWHQESAFSGSISVKGESAAKAVDQWQ
ncbi:HAD hydrolase-like protein [Corynebacterium sp. ES2794-CONJ1]|uniref:HAD-IIA family hydrolase n=1 Tax=unclassified Corynebacterium TaxID=2624378 RepID=UPI002169D4BE|nr:MULTISPECIES: HAD hydrolase-like protein [unclassified Corynebacterium]MCS4489416.1 HAD hydrolase-like protein [Corynebacterium sp. ES2775-CONJ]MCS4491227.1 HAD hydrolase-like protein [Corynebacterium sp. ES2715-CONJ3]MCS4530892.1 HAD hydrolase-like protein [Corynebacterium sp. ES2730-CONJ]MCU9518257.1 HAD hydrolase-like protein [Corynebacterium sp. ES2794-CONJ1]